MFIPKPQSLTFPTKASKEYKRRT